MWSIATRHDSHAQFVQRALAAGKHVFVEKPLALTLSEIDGVEAALEAPAAQARMLMVGFNRRFAPLAVRMKALLGAVRGPKSLIVTVNAGAAPAGHWTLGAAGGGRIIGEACHFIDLLRFLAGCPISGQRVRRTAGDAAGSADPSVCISLSFADGSMGTIHYLTQGHASFPKERVEAFAAGRVLQLDNFRRLRAFGWPGFTTLRLWRQDKGQTACAAAFVQAVKAGAPPPIPLEEILEVSRVTIDVSEAAAALSSLAQYFHTLRHLRPVQIVGRVRFALYRPRPDLRAASPPRAMVNPYAAPMAATPSMLGPDRFRLLNVEGVCAHAADWAGGGRPALWSYNLHYFDDLNAAQASARRAWHDGSDRALGQ